MIFQRTKSAGIVHNSYFVGSGSEAVVIDPRRDSQIYIDLAQQHGLKIKHIFETHRNEDYVIGSIELNSTTNSPIHHGPGRDWGPASCYGPGFYRSTTCWAVSRRGWPPAIR
jgi:hydroxyacylglutathione hydrolase